MAFATVADLQARLAVMFVGDEVAQVQAFLDDATDYITAEVLGGTPWGTDTDAEVDFTLPPGEQWIALPGQPVADVTTVTVDGAATTAYTLTAGRIRLDSPSADYATVSVAYTYGAPVPSTLKRWCLTLAAGAVAAARRGHLGDSGGVASETVGPFSVTYTPDAAAGMAIPERQLHRLRSRYGGGTYVARMAT